jgi:hypothetical protein
VKEEFDEAVNEADEQSVRVNGEKFNVVAGNEEITLGQVTLSTFDYRIKW